MRVMAIMKASSDSEAGKMPSTELLTAMGNFNEELVRAGVILAGEGLLPSSKGVRVRSEGGKLSTLDGPFAEAKELVAGYWLLQVKSLAEAVAYMKRCPNPGGADFEIELRPVAEADDFGPEFTPEARAQEDRLRAMLEAKP